MENSIFDKTNIQDDDKKVEVKAPKKADFLKDEAAKDEHATIVDPDSDPLELLEMMKKKSQKTSIKKQEKKIDEYKHTMATKAKLFSRMQEKIIIPIIINEDEVLDFEIQRLSESENAEILNRKLAMKNLSEMTAEELEESNEYNYRLLEKVVTNPQLSFEEWRDNADTALVQELVGKVMDVLTNIDDTVVYDDFKKK